MLNLAASRTLPPGRRSKQIILDQQKPDIVWNDLLNKDPDEAIGQLFRAFYPMVCQSALRIVADENLAEDLAQEVFFELWKRKDTLSINTSIPAYLKRAVVNRSLNYLRDNRLISVEEEQMLNAPGLQTSAGNTDMEASELEELILRTIDGLPDRCRLVFTLSRYEELSYQEIAGKLDISVKTVENQMTKALKVLRAALGPHLEVIVFLVVIRLLFS
ncbi:MAG: RNA polymerase sigma-70 factor [Lewinellaceae bacterium]|nr:RNA polymerase sigma-70 factor [Lewinellaceae bacterium]